MPSIRSFHDLQQSLASDRAALVQHPLYARIRTLEDVRAFMEHHVFAVWDFMSLLKSLQRELTCVEVPWTPRGDSIGRRLVNEIVLGEESDESPGDGFTSHFELYRAAMIEAGAETSRIDAFVVRVRNGDSIQAALQQAGAPQPAQDFVLGTFGTIWTRSLPQIVAAFTLGREDIIPDMFIGLVADLSRLSGGRLTLLSEYLHRHIRIDGERHGPMSARLLASVCGGDEHDWRSGYRGAHDALVARRVFWDGIASAVGSRAVATSERSG